MKDHLQDIVLRLETGHDRVWWTSPTSMTGGRIVCPIDFVADDLYGYFFYGHHELERWIDGIARIAVSELRFGLSVNFMKELSVFKMILLMMSTEMESEYDSNLNGETFSSLQSKYTEQLLQAAYRQRERIASQELIPNPDYSIRKINNFYEMQPYGAYTSSSSPWCLAYSEKKYDSFSSNGTNSIYVVLHRDFKLMDDIVTTQRCLSFLQDIGMVLSPPYDDYGLSMLLLVTDPDGSLIYCTSRWNHTFKHSSHDYLNEYQLSLFIGSNFYDTFTYCLT